MKLIEAIQAAGHDGAQQSEDGGFFVKPTTRQEVDFYEAIAGNPYMERITCSYYGILTEQTIQTKTEDVEQIVATAEQTQDLRAVRQYMKSTKNQSIVLANLTGGFKHGSILDIKLGSQLWDESATPEKRERLERVSTSTTSGSHGFRIAGMSVWDDQSKQRVAYDKTFGRNVKSDVESILQAFEEYLKYLRVEDRRKYLARQIYEEIDFIHEILSEQETRMISASILIVYEGDEESYEARKDALLKKEQTLDVQLAGRNGDGCEKDERSDSGSDEEEELHDDKLPLVRVRLIDFAHSQLTPGKGPDTNVLQGLVWLRRIFKALSK